MTDVYRETSWMDNGECLQYPGDLFFPERGESDRRAKEICLGCEVVAICREDAIGKPEIGGVRGATSERERRKLRKARNG